MPIHTMLLVTWTQFQLSQSSIRCRFPPFQPQGDKVFYYYTRSNKSFDSWKQKGEGGARKECSLVTNIVLLYGQASGTAAWSVSVLRYPRVKKVRSLQLCLQDQIITRVHVLFKTAMISSFSVVHNLYLTCFPGEVSTIISKFSDFLLFSRQFRWSEERSLWEQCNRTKHCCPC